MILACGKILCQKLSSGCDIVNAFEGEGRLVATSKTAVAGESLLDSLKEIYQCYMKLVEEAKRAESKNIQLLKLMKEDTSLTLAVISLMFGCI